MKRAILREPDGTRRDIAAATTWEELAKSLGNTLTYPSDAELELVDDGHEPDPPDKDDVLVEHHLTLLQFLRAAGRHFTDRHTALGGLLAWLQLGPFLAFYTRVDENRGHAVYWAPAATTRRRAHELGHHLGRQHMPWWSVDMMARHPFRVLDLHDVVEKHRHRRHTPGPPWLRTTSNPPSCRVLDNAGG